MDLTRRAVCLVGAAGAAVLVGGCTGGDSSSAPGTTRSVRRATRPTTPPSSGGSSAAAARPPLPGVRPWTPSPADLQPACKLVAVRRIERDGNAPGRALQVVDAQYGGLLTDAASVLVVTRSWHRHGSAIVPGGHTFDVRLSRRGASWRVTAVHPSHPGPAGSTSDRVRRVLGSDRIQLPPAARHDLLSGQVHDSVAAALLTLSARFRISVSVVRSGHPLYVFGTDRLSDHPQGRAFDTWRIDGHPVVSAPRGLVIAYMRAVAAAGSYNVGGPVLLGVAPQWFSDATHHDHVHAGFAT